MYAFIGMWVLRRAFRILTAEDSRPLAVRVGAEGKRILVGAAITLGLDPGISATGYGAVVFDRGSLALERCGVWRPPDGLAFAVRLHFLFEHLAILLGELRPQAVSVETVFSAKNVSSR